MKRKIAAILAADIVGYSRLVAEDEEDTLSRLDSYRRVYEDFVTRAGGRIFNTAGDSVLAEFSSAVEATRCAIDIQESIRTRNLGYPASRQMLFRMGLTIGDVVEREGDLLGDGVNIAARLEGLAAPGGICVSQSVFEQVANKLSVPFRDMGQQEVKNIPQPVHAFMVEMRGEGVKPQGNAPRNTQQAGRSRVSSLDQNNGNRGVGLALLAGLAALVIGLVALTAVFWPKLQPVPAVPEVAGDAGASKPQSGGKKSQQQAKAPDTAKPDNAKPDNAKPDAAKPDAAKPAAPAPSSKPQIATPVPVPPQPVKPPVPAGSTAAQAFAILSKAGGIVQDAKTPAELYHNARVWESRGQASEARTAYAKLAGQGGDFIDVHMRYAAILRAQDGRAGAREIYEGLAQARGGRASVLVHGLQFAGTERRSRIAAFASQQPDYAPAQMLLAREYSLSRLGRQTLSDKRRQFAALSSFLKAEDQGVLPKFFMDHSVLSEWVDEARRKHRQLETYFKTAVLEPSATYMRSNQGWMVNLALPEAASAIFYRIGEAGPFTPTGTFPHIDQRTGRPMANPSFELPPNAKATRLAIRYRDTNNNEHGPFELAFEPLSALISGNKNLLQRFTSSWLVFGKDYQNGKLYFSDLLSYRCAIKRAVLAFNDGPLEKELPIPQCDMRDPFAVPGNSQIYLTIPASVRSVRVQLTYADGEKSAVKTFSRE